MNTMFNKLIQNYPISLHLSTIVEQLKESSSRSLILTAETGAGKSTVLPLALLEAFDGNIVMTEPRRLAVVGCASRMAELLEEDCGEQVGYKIHLENKTSEKTRLTVETEAILVKQLQEDPSLEGINLVVLDEFHERGINLDLSLAFLKEAMELRDDLFVIVMSATIQTKKISDFLGWAPVYKVPGRTFPVEIEYADGLSVVSAVKKELNFVHSGTILVFLPGIVEIKRAHEELCSYFDTDSSIEITILHSSVTLEEQKKVLVPVQNNKTRIVLSSAIAETSLTIPDVVSVIDTGLCRVNKLNIGTGLPQLVTQQESEFSACQRTGRAGRVQKGRCVRLWSKNLVLSTEKEPEIKVNDLSEVVLECADRGVVDIHKIQFLDSPSVSLWNSSVMLLKQLGFLDELNHITPLGRLALKLPLSPRLSGIALSYIEGSLQLVLEYSPYAQSSNAIKQRFLEDLKRRLEKLKLERFNIEKPGIKLSVLYGFSDRVARRVSENGAKNAEYQFAMGRKAFLSEECKTSPLWICAPEVKIGQNRSTIYNFETLEGKDFEQYLMQKSIVKTESVFENGKILTYRRRYFGCLVMEENKIASSQEDFANAWVNLVKKQGLKVLELDAKCEDFLLRSEFYAISQGKSFDRDELAMTCENWLKPFLQGVNKITCDIVYDAFYWYLDGQKVDSQVPQVLELENKRKVKVCYERCTDSEGNARIQPVIQVIIQRIFGCFTTPKICGVPVLLKLLSPASRPLQITTDLQGFWSGSWIEICKEMKGRYPKHNWDYRVAED